MNNLKEAKASLERILQREWDQVSTAREEYWQLWLDDQDLPSDDETRRDVLRDFRRNTFFVRKDADEIIGKGTRQVVLKIGHGYVAKFPIVDNTTNYYFGDNISVDYAEQNVTILRELGFHVQDHYPVSIRHNKTFKVEDVLHTLRKGSRLYSTVIVEDLSEDGKYEVEDLTADRIKSLSNGAELNQQLDYILNVLKSVHNNEHFLYSMKLHAHNNTPEEAITRMVFIKVDPSKNTGQLVIGDLDHIALYRKPTQQVTN